MLVRDCVQRLPSQFRGLIRETCVLLFGSSGSGKTAAVAATARAAGACIIDLSPRKLHSVPESPNSLVKAVGTI